MILPKVSQCRVAYDAGGVGHPPRATHAVARHRIPVAGQLLPPLHLSCYLSVNVTSHFNLCITQVAKKYRQTISFPKIYLSDLETP